MITLNNIYSVVNPIKIGQEVRLAQSIIYGTFARLSCI